MDFPIVFHDASYEGFRQDKRHQNIVARNSMATNFNLEDEQRRLQEENMRRLRELELARLSEEQEQEARKELEEYDESER
ncbi:unnamed protein product [Rotaria socialis]|uniref:Uncharacterized protein n=1 Tax=Rotaria socialis TaxID=392032 RepID=A0A818J3M3_9BILA|nr:unnamed protein product [Rotaria socialis]